MNCVRNSGSLTHRSSICSIPSYKAGISMDLKLLWKQRRSGFWNGILPYVGYVIQSGVAMVFLFLVIAFSAWYTSFVQNIPAGFPIRWIALVLLAPLALFSSYRTYLLPADIVFLRPQEYRMQEYLKTALFVALFIKCCCCCSYFYAVAALCKGRCRRQTTGLVDAVSRVMESIVQLWGVARAENGSGRGIQGISGASLGTGCTCRCRLAMAASATQPLVSVAAGCCIYRGTASPC